MGGAQHVKCADEVDVDHGPKAVGRQIKRTGQEVARRTRHQHVNVAPRGMHLGQHLLHARGVAHVTRVPQHRLAVARQLRLGRDHAVGIAAHHRHARASCGIGVGNAQVDAAGATRDEHRAGR